MDEERSFRNRIMYGDSTGHYMEVSTTRAQISATNARLTLDVAYELLRQDNRAKF